MLQLRPGDLVAIENDGVHVVAAILTKQILFGGHWSFMFHGTHEAVPSKLDFAGKPSGFNAAVDFILPKREGRLTRILRDGSFSALLGPELVTQAPLRGEKNYRVWKWNGGSRQETEFVRFTPTPSVEEQTAPPHGCLAADFAWKLAARGWSPGTSMYETPNKSLERTRGE
jgi:hypothetical protein